MRDTATWVLGKFVEFSIIHTRAARVALHCQSVLKPDEFITHMSQLLVDSNVHVLNTAVWVGV